MKTKNGKIKLEKGDIRVGNFVLSVEEQHIKVQDLNKYFTLRFHKRMPVGIWLDSSSPEQTVPYLWSEENPASKPLGPASLWPSEPGRGMHFAG